MPLPSWRIITIVPTGMTVEGRYTPPMSTVHQSSSMYGRSTPSTITVRSGRLPCWLCGKAVVIVTGSVHVNAFLGHVANSSRDDLPS